jgi:hypothetical protein
MKGEANWQFRIVIGEGGKPAVRFLGPYRHTIVEIPADEVALAAQLLGYEILPPPKGGA